MNTNALPAVLAAFCLALSTAACASTTTSASGRQPALAFGATTGDVPGACAIEGMPRVVATHVVPKAGVRATASGGHVWLRFETKGAPRAVLALDPDSLDGVAAGDPPVEVAAPADETAVGVALEDGRWLRAWTEGSLESGLDVKLAAVAPDGATSAPLDLGYEGSAVGRPALAATPDGRGVVAFIESNGAGFHLVATRVVCPAR